MRLAFAAGATVLMLAGPAWGQATPPPDPVMPPLPVVPSGPKGAIQIAERFDRSKGVPREGYRSSATILKRDDGDPTTAEPYFDELLPYGRRTLVGGYEITAGWQVGMGVSGQFDRVTNRCRAYIRVRRKGDVRRLLVLRNALGCRIALRPDRARCQQGRKQGGNAEKRRCRLRVLKPIQVVETPWSPPPGKPLIVPTVTLTPYFHNFGEVPVGATSPPHQITATNVTASAKGPLSFTETGSGVDHFEFSDDNCTGVTLAPNETCTFEVSFAPGAPGFVYLYLGVDHPGSPSGMGADLRGTGI